MSESPSSTRSGQGSDTTSKALEDFKKNSPALGEFLESLPEEQQSEILRKADEEVAQKFAQIMKEAQIETGPPRPSILRKLLFTVLLVPIVYMAELVASAWGSPGMGFRIGIILAGLYLWNLWIRNRWPDE